MELQLGLGLMNSRKGAVLNVKELGLMRCESEGCDSNLCSESSVCDVVDDCDSLKGKKKRDFDGAFEGDSSSVTLNLLGLNKDPNGDDDEDEDEQDEHKRVCRIRSFFFDKNGEGESIIGWPPIKSYRKKLCHDNDNHRAAPENGDRGGGRGRRGSMYVKVQMKGVVITRKIDLSLHHSYSSLSRSLLSLFGKCQDSVEEYIVTYQDKEGDWLLAGDVPWSEFIISVRRLRLLRRNA